MRIRIGIKKIRGETEEEYVNLYKTKNAGKSDEKEKLRKQHKNIDNNVTSFLPIFFMSFIFFSFSNSFLPFLLLLDFSLSRTIIHFTSILSSFLFSPYQYFSILFFSSSFQYFSLSSCHPFSFPSLLPFLSPSQYFILFLLPF